MHAVTVSNQKLHAVSGGSETISLGSAVADQLSSVVICCAGLTANLARAGILRVSPARTCLLAHVLVTVLGEDVALAARPCPGGWVGV